MATKRRRKRRSADYRPPTTRRAAREAATGESQPARPERARRSDPDRPPPPWGGFPLVELVILISLVLLIVGFFFVGETRGTVMIAAGLTLGSLAALELTIREHFTGYRSHTTVLAGFGTVIVLGIGFWMEWPQILKLAAGAATFAIGFYGFREAFKRRSGGLGFR
jgi:hypothetical protein